MAIVSADHLFPNGCDGHLNNCPYFARLCIRERLGYGDHRPGDSDINQGLLTLPHRQGLHAQSVEGYTETAAHTVSLHVYWLETLSQSLDTIHSHD